MNYRWKLLRAGPISLDGGGMFGIIPRVVWSKVIPADDRGRITLAHNCLLLKSDAHTIVIETGSGNKFDAKMKNIFNLSDHTIQEAVDGAGTRCEDVDHVVVSHLHFDHAGGVTKLSPAGRIELTFPNARVHSQKREWEDALANKSTMTRTYYRENLDPIRDRIQLVDSPLAFREGCTPDRNELPATRVADRMSEILPGVFVFRTPGHTWGQQAILFTDDRGRKIVFTPDVMPTVHHVGITYNLAYDVEAYTSGITRHWFLQEASDNDWLLVLDHEADTPVVRVRPDGKDWFKLVPEDL